MPRLQTYSRRVAIEHICLERDHQLRKYGEDKEQSLPGYLVIIESKLAEAKLAWLKGGEGRNAAMHEVVQIAATALAAIEAYGAEGCPRSTNDELVVSDGEGAWLEACAKACRCCTECSVDRPCAGVCAGGICDRMCLCDREGDERCAEGEGEDG